MGFEFACESCGKRLTVPPALYEKRVRGRVVTVSCKTCGAAIRIDGTIPPPPLIEHGSHPSASHSGLDTPAIPKAPRLPDDERRAGENAGTADGSFDAKRRSEPSGLPSPHPDARALSPVPPSTPREAVLRGAPRGKRLSSSSPPPVPRPGGLRRTTTSNPPPPSEGRAPTTSSQPTRDFPELRRTQEWQADPSRPTRPEPVSFPDGSADQDEPAPISHATGLIAPRAPIEKIGRYALFDTFASGGMATVHMGRLDGAGGFSRVVAIKRLLPHLVQSSEFTEMLLQEARLAARVRHPNVVPTLDVVASKREVLLVMEYIHGESLNALCRAQAKRRQRIPVEVAVSIMHGVLLGLHAVHEATDEKGRTLGLVHRDVSPQNVMVGADGMARVLDFGIVKALQQIEETLPNRLKGKTGYMSPEQIVGERVTRAADVFAAGILLWELLTLKRFSSAASDKERIDRILAGNYARPSTHRLELDPALDEVVMRALAFRAEERYPTARDFADALIQRAEAANSSVVADWVQSLIEKTLLERARLVAQVENWDDGGPEIELSSTPFAVERGALNGPGAGVAAEQSPRPRISVAAATRTPMPPISGSSASPAAGGAGGTPASAAPAGLLTAVQPSVQAIASSLLERLSALRERVPSDPKLRAIVLAVSALFVLIVAYWLFR